MQNVENIIANTITKLLRAFNDSKNVFFYTFAFGLVAHGFVYFNEVFSHDSLYLNHTYDSLALGRWGQALFLNLRGAIISPTLIGFLSLFFLAISNSLFLDLFKIKNKVAVIIICGTLVTSFVYTTIAATYIYFLDVNTLALLFAILSCYVIKNVEQIYLKLVGASLFLLLSISLYQAYFQVYTLICGMLFLIDCIKGKEIKELANTIAFYVLVIVVALVCYKISVILSLKVTPINNLSSGYNGLNNAGSFQSIEQAIELIFKATHKGFVKILKYPTFFTSTTNIILLSINLIIAMYFIYKMLKKNKVQMLLCQLSLLILVPFFANTVYILSKGLMHDLMKYSYSIALLTPLIIALNAKYRRVDLSEKSYNSLLGVICTVLALLIFSNTVYSNQAYLKKELEAKSSLSIATRILDRIEMLPGFIPNKTRVCFIGEASQNPYFKIDRVYLDSKNRTPTGLNNYVAFTYNTAAYYQSIMGIKFSICDNSKLDNIYVAKMPLFPSINSVIMLNDQVVVKLGDITK